VTIRVLKLVGNHVADETVEHHTIRYFKRVTLTKLLEAAGMELLRLGSFPEYWHEPDTQYWSALGIARAVG
jgi:hypothetical protein